MVFNLRSSYEKSNSDYWKVITKITNRSLKNWARYARYSLEKSVLTPNTSTEVLQKMHGSLAFLLFSISAGFVDSFCLRGRAKKAYFILRVTRSFNSLFPTHGYCSVFDGSTVMLMTQYANSGVQPQSQGSLHFTGTSRRETWERG